MIFAWLTEFSPHIYLSLTDVVSSGRCTVSGGASSHKHMHGMLLMRDYLYEVCQVFYK